MQNAHGYQIVGVYNFSGMMGIRPLEIFTPLTFIRDDL
jgi:hypothetical protein